MHLHHRRELIAAALHLLALTIIALLLICGLLLYLAQ